MPSRVFEVLVVQLRHQFHNLCKTLEKIIDYLAEMKTIYDYLTVVESPVSNKEQVQHNLCSLSAEYNMFYTGL